MSSTGTGEAVGEVQPLSYAGPRGEGASSRILFPLGVLFAGLGLIFLAGCFLIGVLIILSDPMLRLTDAATLLLAVLYGFSFLSFAAGAVAVVLGLKWLYRNYAAAVQW